VKKDLKCLSDALGAARDLDVEIGALEKSQRKAERESIKAALGKMIEKSRTRRGFASRARKESV